jgi:hypothetical protein
MGYTDKTLGKDARKANAGPLGTFKGKATGSTDIKGKSGKSPAKKKK